MNILRGLKRTPNDSRAPLGSLRDKLPSINAFVDIAIGGSLHRESVPVNDITASAIVTRCPNGLQPGESADFLYGNAFGRFRFATACAKVDGKEAYFELPAAVKTLESYGDRRTSERVPWLLPVQWRYAPSGSGYGDFLAGSLMDISRGGASLVVGRMLKPGSQVELRFALKSQQEPFVELCQVVRAAKIETSDKNAAGILFLDLDPHDERTLGEYLDERLTLRRDRGVV
jgi:hypothetical protein